MNFGTDKGEVLVPSVVEGQFMTGPEAEARYRQTGQHLGIFDTPEAADAYAEILHNSQAAMGNVYSARSLYGGLMGKRRK